MGAVPNGLKGAVENFFLVFSHHDQNYICELALGCESGERGNQSLKVFVRAEPSYINDGANARGNPERAQPNARLRIVKDLKDRVVCFSDHENSFRRDSEMIENTHARIFRYRDDGVRLPSPERNFRPP